MGFAESFEDLLIWQRSRVLPNEIYDALGKNRDYDFPSQIESAPRPATSSAIAAFLSLVLFRLAIPRLIARMGG